MIIFRKIFNALIILVITGLSLQVKAQDPNYSQFFSNPLYFNPAYTGISQGLRLRFDYRKQWPRLANDFKTFNFNSDVSVRQFPGSGGLGLIFHKDKAGAGYLETATAGLLTSVRIRISEKSFTQVGILSSFTQKYVNWEKFVFTDQISPRYGNIFDSEFIPPAENRIAYPDFNVGSIFRFIENTSNLTKIIGTFGVAVHHVFEPNETFFEGSSPLPRRLVIHADLVFEPVSYSRYGNAVTAGQNARVLTKINPGAYYQVQGEFKTYSFGVNLFVMNLYGGLWYRNNDFDFINSEALVLMLGLNSRFTEQSRLKILYSFDLSLNDNLISAGGAHELSILIELDDISLFGNRKGFSGPGVKSSRGNVVYEALECSPF